MGIGFPWGMMGVFWNRMVLIVAQTCDYSKYHCTIQTGEFLCYVEYMLCELYLNLLKKKKTIMEEGGSQGRKSNGNTGQGRPEGQGPP